MTEQIDKRIAALEQEIAELKRQKLAILQRQVAEIQSSLSGAPAAAPAVKAARGTKAAKPEKAAKPAKPAKAGGPKRRGRRPGKRIPDEVALANIKKLVVAAGKEGISGRKVSQETGLFYQRVVGLLDANFKKTGERKWTRYFAK